MGVLLNIYLVFLNKDRSPSRIFSGEIDVYCTFKHGFGRVTELCRPLNEMEITIEKCEQCRMNFRMFSSICEYEIDVIARKSITPFGPVNTGLSGTYVNSDGRELDSGEAVVSLIPRLITQ